MQIPVEIKKAIPEDIPSLALMSSAAFYETYAEFNTDSDMLHYTRIHFSEEKIREEMLDPDITFFISESEGVLTGYAACKLIIQENEKKLELLRLYVLKQFQKTGTGKKLMDEVILHAKKMGAKNIFLYVWKENIKAISFYKKIGFSIEGETVFDWGTGKKDDDWVMKFLIRE